MNQLGQPPLLFCMLRTFLSINIEEIKVRLYAAPFSLGWVVIRLKRTNNTSVCYQMKEQQKTFFYIFQRLIWDPSRLISNAWWRELSLHIAIRWRIDAYLRCYFEIDDFSLMIIVRVLWLRTKGLPLQNNKWDLCAILDDKFTHLRHGSSNWPWK
jgi:hypothetical protein